MSNESPLLDIQQLQVSTADNILLQNVNFHIQPAERVGIKGESGAGKSIFLKALLKLLPPPLKYGCHKHQYVFGETNITIDRADRKTLRLWYRDHVAMIFQNAELSLNPLQKIEKQLKESFAVLDNSSAQEDWLNQLTTFGFSDPSAIVNKYPHQCSGGELQKLMLFQAIYKKAKLIIADEPTASLDKTTETYLINQLDQYARLNNAAIILISHDDRLLSRFCDRILVMIDGQLHPSSFPNKKMYSTKKTAEAYTKDILLEVEDVSVVYENQRWLNLKKYTALKKISLVLNKDEIIAIVGPTGSGKSTLIKTITGQVTPLSGQVRMEQINIQALNRQELTSSVQVLHQNPDLLLNPNMTVETLLEEPYNHLLGYSLREARNAAHAMIKVLGLKGQILHSKPYHLSGGEKQRVALGRLLSLSPKLLILDEPFSALDVESKELISSLVLRLKKEFNFTLLIISHDLVTIRSLVERVIILDNGSIIEQGNTKDIFSNPMHTITKALIENNFASQHEKKHYE